MTTKVFGWMEMEMEMYMDMEKALDTGMETVGDMEVIGCTGMGLETHTGTGRETGMGMGWRIIIQDWGGEMEKVKIPPTT